MAVTYAISDREFFTSGNKVAVRGLATPTGTTTDNGDSFTASAVGLQLISDLWFSNAVDSASNPENALLTVPIKQTDGTWKIVYATAAQTPTAATSLTVITDGTTVTNYISRFVAFSDRA